VFLPLNQAQIQFGHIIYVSRYALGKRRIEVVQIGAQAPRFYDKLSILVLGALIQVRIFLNAFINGLPGKIAGDIDWKTIREKVQVFAEGSQGKSFKERIPRFAGYGK